MTKIQVYKYKQGHKENGVIRTLKPGINYEEYKAKQNKAGIEVIKTKEPTLNTLMRWEEAGYSKAIDGCKVEPDGTCRHGYPSFLKVIGVI